MKSSSIKKQTSQTRSIGSKIWTPRSLPFVIAWYGFRQFRNQTANPEFCFDFSGRNLGVTFRQPTLNNRPSIGGPSSDVFPLSKHLTFTSALSERFLLDSTPPDALDFKTGDFIFCCAIHAGTVSTNNTIISLQRENNDEEIRIYLNNTGLLSAKFGNGTVATASEVDDGNPHIVSVTRINGKLQAFVDGVGGTERDNTVDFDNDVNMVLGALNSSGGQEFNGDIAEVCFGATRKLGAIKTKDRIRLEGFVANRLGISSVLPDTHNYKVAPPKK